MFRKRKFRKSLKVVIRLKPLFYEKKDCRFNYWVFRIILLTRFVNILLGFELVLTLVKTLD